MSFTHTPSNFVWRLRLLQTLLITGLVFAGILFFSHQTFAAVRTWDGGGTDGTCGGGAGDGNKWSCDANWSDDTEPGTSDVATFSATSTKNATIDANISVSGIDINTGYSGIITQGSGFTVTVGTGDFDISDGTFTGGDSTIDINDALTVSGGAFTSTTGNLTLAGAFTVTSGSFEPSTGTVVADNTTSTWNVLVTETFNHLTVNRSSTLVITSGDTIVVAGTLTLTAGSVQTGTIDARGNISQGASFVGGSAIIDFGDDVVSQTYTINGGTGPTLRLNAAGDASDTLVISAAGTLTAYTITSGFSGTAQITNASDFATTVTTWTQDAGTVNLSAQSSWIISDFNLSAGTFTAPTTVTKNSGNAAWDVNSTQTFNNLTINAPSSTMTITSGDTLVASGTLTLTDGVVSVGTIDARGNISQASTFDGGTAIIDYGDNGVAQTYTINGGIAPTIRFDSSSDANDSLTITAAATVTLLNITSGFSGTVPITNTNNSTLTFTTWTQDAGTYDASAQSSWTIIDFNLSAGTFTAPTTVTKTSGNATWDVNVTQTFNNFVINTPSSTLTIATGDTLITTGTLTFTDGLVNTGTLEARGSISYASTFDGGTASFDFGNNALAQTLTLSGGTFIGIRFDDPADANDLVTFTAATPLRAVTITSGFSGTVPITNPTDYAVTISTAWTQGAGTYDASAQTSWSICTFTTTGGTFTAPVTVTTPNCGNRAWDVNSTQTFNNLDFNNATDTLTIGSGDTITVTGTLTFTDGTVNGTAVISGQGAVTVATTFDGGSATLEFSGSATQSFTITGGTGLYNGDINVNKSGGQVNLTTALVMDALNQDLVIVEGKLNLAGNNLTVNGSSGTFVVQDGGNFQLRGAETITLNATYPTLSTGSTVTYTGDGDAGADTYTITTLKAVYHHLVINSTDGATDTFQLGAALDINGNFTNTAGTVDVVSGQNYAITLAGNWSNSGTFTPRSGTVTLDASTNHTLSGATTWYNLTLLDSSDNATYTVLTLPISTTQSIAGTLNLDGLDATDRLSIVSSSGGSVATIDFTGSGVFSGDYLVITDITATDNSSGMSVPINPSNSTDGGNTIGWFTSSVTFTGTVYTNEGVTNIGTGKTVRVLHNGADTAVSADTDESGAYSLDATALTIASGDVLTFYLDDETENGVRVTRYDTGDLSSMNIYQNYLIVSHEDAGPLSNTNLDTADNADPGGSSDDISSIYSVSAGTLTTASSSIELLVNTGDTYTPGGAVDANGNLDINGTLVAAANAVNVAGNFDNAGTFTHTGVLTLDGTSSQAIISGGSTFGSDVVIANTAAVVSLSANAFNIGANDLTINASAILSLAGQNLTATGTFSNSGTFRLQGGETISLTQDTDSGTFQYLGDGDGNADTYTLIDLGVTDYYNLAIATTDTNDIVQSAAAKTIAGTLAISSGTYNANGNTTGVTGIATVSGGTYTASSATQTFTALTVNGGTFTGAGGTVDVNGTLTISSGAMTAPSGSLTIQTNFTYSGGTFTHNSGTVVLDANADHAITGSPTWNNLTLQDTSDNATDVILTIAASSTQTIVGTLTLDGLDASDRLNIVSSAPSTASVTLFSGSSTFTGDFLDITDNTVTDSSSGVTSPLNPANSVNGGNANGWFLTALAGHVYSDEGSTGIGASITVRLLKNGADTSVTADTDGSSAYSMDISGLSFSSGDVLTVYLDDETPNGVLVTRTDGSTLTGLDVYQNYLLIRHEDAGPVSNTNLDTADNADPGSSSDDISSIYSISGGNLITTSSSVELLVNASSTFTPGGAVDANGNLDINGTLVAAANAVNVAGGFDNAGTFTHTGILTFDGTNAQAFVPGGSAIGSDVVIANTSAAVSLSTNTLDIGANDLTINSSAILALAGQGLTASGTFANNGTLRVRGSETVTLTQDTNSGIYEYIGDGDSSADTFTMTDFGTTDYYNLSIATTDSNDVVQSGAAKVVAGTLSISSGRYNANTNTSSITGATTVSGGTYTASTNTQTFTTLTVNGGTFTGAGGTVDVNGALVISSGVFTAPSGALTLQTDFTHSSGTFSHNSGTVTFDADASHTITGSSTWNNLTLQNTSDDSTDVVLTIAASSTQTIVGVLTLDGLDDSDRLNIVSSSPATSAITVFSGSSSFTGDYLDITDNTVTDNSTGVTVPLSPANSVNGGNAGGWFLSSFAGIVYSNEGVTEIGADYTVRLLENGVDTGVTDDTDASGTYSLDVSSLSFDSGDVLTVYLDNENSNGVTVLRYDNVELGNIDIYVNYLIVRHEDAGPITNTNLDTADNADPGVSSNDISSIYTVSGGNLATGTNIELLVNTGDTFTPGGNVDSNGNLDINGTLVAGANAVNVARNFDNGGTFTHTGILTFDGTISQTVIVGGSTIGSDVVIANTTSAVSLSTNALNIGANDLTINSNAILALAGQNMTVSGTFSNNGTFRVKGDETLTFTQDLDSGTYEYVGGGAQTYSLADYGDTDYYNLSIATHDSNDVIQSGAANVVAGTLSISAGTYAANTNTTSVTGTTTVSGGTYSASSATQTLAALTVNGGTFTGAGGTVDVNGTLTISSGVFTAPSGALTIQGNFTHSSGTFTHNSGTVTFDADANHTISGDSTWNNLTLQNTSDNTTDVILTVAASSTQTIVGTLTLDGLDANDRLNIVSSTPSTAAVTLFSGSGAFSGDYLDISDNTVTDSSSSISTPINPANSVNSGNSSGWYLSAFTGTVYSDEGLTGIGTGKTIRLLQNGTDTGVTADTNGSSAYSLDVSLLTLNSGDVLTVYLDDETENGVAVSRFETTIGSINVYQNFLIVRHEDAGPLSNTNLDTADNTDPGASSDDISSIYSVSSGNLATASSSIELLVNSGSTYTPGGNVDANGNLDINGTLVAAANAVNVAGGFDNAGTFTHTGILTFDGTSSQTVIAGGSAIGSDVVIANTAAAVSLSTDDLDLGANDLTINSSAILSLGGQDLVASGTFANNGTLRLWGSETLTLTQDTNSGTFAYVGDADGGADTFTLIDFGGTDYYNLAIATTDSGDVIQSAAAKAIAGTLAISSGTYNANTNTTSVTGTTTVSGGTYTASSATQTLAALTVNGGTFTGAGGTVDVNGALTISSGVFTAPSGSLTIQGSFTHSGGTFTHNSGTATFDANANHTISGDSTWNNLTLQDTADDATDVVLTIAASSTQTVVGTLTLDGLDASDRLNIVSATPGTAAVTLFSGSGAFSGDFLDISDNTVTDSSTGVTTPIYPTSSVNSGNAAGWFLATITGSVYTNEGITGIGTGKTIRLLLNGADTSVTSDTDGSSAFSLDVDSVNFTSGDVLTLYLDDETENGVAVSRFETTMSTMDVYQNYLIVRHEDAGPVSNANLATADNADPGVSSDDISSIYSVTGSDLATASSSIELLVNTGDTFTPGGNVDANGNLDINGTLVAAANAVNVAGGFDNAGTLTHTGILTFDGTVAQTVIAGGSAIGSDVVIANTSAAVSLSTNALNLGANDLTINSSAVLALAGQNLTASGTFANNGTLRVRGDETVTLTQDTNSGTYEYVGDGDSVVDTFILTDFGGTDYYNLSIAMTDSGDVAQLGAAKAIAGTLVVSAGTYDANTNTTGVTGVTTVSGGTYSASSATQTFTTLTINGGTFTGAGGTVDVNGTLTISSGVFTAPSGSLTIQGNFAHSGGTFTHNSGGVTFDANANHTISGSNTWNNLTLQDTADDATDVILTVEASSVQTIEGILTWDGLDASDRLNIVSATPSTAAVTAFTGSSTFSGDFLDITDNTITDSSSGVTTPVTPADSVDGGNSTGWFTTASSGGGGSSNYYGGNTPATITLLSPEAGDVLTGAAATDIIWRSDDSSYVNIYVSYDAGVTYDTLVENTRNDGSWTWSVPNLDANAAIKVALTDLVTDTAIDSAEDVTIVSVTDEEEVENPDDEESWPGETPVIDVVLPNTYIRGRSFPSVYYVDNLMVRHPIYNEDAYFTHQDSWSAVQTVSDATLPTMMIGDVLLPKPGVVLVKIQSAPQVYAIFTGENGATELRWLESEAVAITMYGSSWADHVIDIPPTFWTKFTFGPSIIEPVEIDRTIMKRRMDLHE